MNNYSMSMALSMLFVCATASLNANNYQTIQERQDVVTSKYNAIQKKWKLLLNAVSEKNANLVIKSLENSLKEQIVPTSNTKEVKQAKIFLNELETLPYTFVCQELDRDIQIIVQLKQEANALNMTHDMDILKFRAIQAKIEKLPDFEEEVAEMASLKTKYKVYLAALVTGALGYAVYKYTNKNPLVTAWDTLALSATTIYNYPSQK